MRMGHSLFAASGARKPRADFCGAWCSWVGPPLANFPWALHGAFLVIGFMLASVRRLPAWWASARNNAIAFLRPRIAVFSWSVFLIYPLGSRAAGFLSHRLSVWRDLSASCLFLQGFHNWDPGPVST